MASGGIFGAAQFLAGGLISLIPGGAAFGVPLMIGGGATILGSLVAPRPAGGAGGFDTSATYGFDQPQNVAYEGAPKFFVLGEEEVHGTYISAFTESEGDEEQFYGLLFMGTGGRYGIESITNVRINDQTIENFPDVKYEVRYGTSTQSVVNGYEKVGHTYNQSQALVKNTAWTYESKGDIDEIVLGLAFYSGLYIPDQLGGMYTARARFKVEAKPRSSSTWATINPRGQFDWSTRTSGPISFRTFGRRSQRSSGANVWTVSGTTSGVVREAFRIPLHDAFPSDAAWQAQQKFDVRITALDDPTSGDIGKATVVRVEEIIYDSRAYPGDSLLAVRAIASSELAGGFPKISATVRGWKCEDPRDGSTVWTRNPAVCVREFLVNSDDGCGEWIAESDLLDGSGQPWRTVADACDANAADSGEHKEARFQLDLVVDSIQDAKDWLDHILMTFRAELLEYQGKIAIVQDVGGTSDRTFDARMSPAASTRPVLANDDRSARITIAERLVDQLPNIVRGAYRDRDDGYARRQTDEIKDQAALDAGDPEVRHEYTLLGITRTTQATREIRYRLNLARLAPDQIQIGIGPGDQDLLPGDVITAYADSPKELVSGATYLVTGVEYDPIGMEGTIYGRAYDAGVYSDTSDTLPTKALSLLRADALKQARRVPIGASWLKIEEIPARGMAT